MPQFDTSLFASQIFWSIVSFAVLFVVLSRWILPRIAAVLRQRARQIEDEIAQARQARQQAEALKLEYADRLAEVDRDAREMFDAAEKRILERRNQLMAEWREEMERKKRIFLDDTEVVRQRVIREIRADSAELIAAATEKLIRQKVDVAEAQQLIEETIKELERNASGKH